MTSSSSALLPLPNLSQRFGYSSSTARILGQRGTPVAAGTFVHHGSAEHGQDPRRHSRRFSSRDRDDMRGHSPSVTSLSRTLRVSAPQGAQERQDWLEALKDIDARVKTLESSNRNLAQAISKTADIANGNCDKIEELHSDRVRYKAYVEKIFYHGNDSIRNVTARMNAKLNEIAG